MSLRNTKLYWWIYFVIALVTSFYTHLNATNFLYFMIGSLVTFGFFIGIYLCLKNIFQNRLGLKVAKIIGIIVFLGLVFVSWTLATFYGYHSSYCYNVVGENSITKTTKVYCNFPPWYTTVIGGEEARQLLFIDCAQRKSEFYDLHFDYCDVYKYPHADKDWTRGPNP